MGIAITERDVEHESEWEEGKMWTLPVILRGKDRQDGQDLAAKGLEELQHPFSCSDNWVQKYSATLVVRNRGSDGVE